MRKKFIVLVESEKENQSEDFIKWIKEKNLAWWHWIQGSWLIVDAGGDFSVGEIRDKAHEIFGDSNVLVIQVRGNMGAWSGYGPASEGKDMFKWLRETWDKKDQFDL